MNLSDVERLALAAVTTAACFAFGERLGTYVWELLRVELPDPWTYRYGEVDA